MFLKLVHDFVEREQNRYRTIGLEHSRAPQPFWHTDPDASQVLRISDRPDIICDMPEADLPERKKAKSLGFCRRLEGVSEYCRADAGHMRPVANKKRHVENAKHI